MFLLHGCENMTDLIEIARTVSDSVAAIRRRAFYNEPNPETIAALCTGKAHGVPLESDLLLFDAGAAFFMLIDYRTLNRVSFNGGVSCYRCEECGCWEYGYEHRVGTQYYCSDECLESAGLEVCSECGSAFRASGPEFANRYRTYCSEDCAVRSGDFERCDRCGDVHGIDDMRTVRDGGDDEYWCEYCTDDYSQWCEQCDTRVSDDSFNFDADCCNECCSRNLHEYGWTPLLEFHGDTGKNSWPYLGVELETDSSYKASSRSEYVNSLASMQHFDRVWLTRDSSLNEGVEVTSHPMTLAEHVSCGVWSEVRNAAVRNGFVSHNAGTCGLHVHVNRDFFGKSEMVRNVGGHKMLRLAQRFERQLMIFTRRESARWCSYETEGDYSLKPVKVSVGTGREGKSLLEKAADSSREERAHSQCVNFEHCKTFEIRIFRGTLRLETLYASLALAQEMARAAKLHGESWIERCTWYEFAQWAIADCEDEEAKHALESYMQSKGLLGMETAEGEEL